MRIMENKGKKEFLTSIYIDMVGDYSIISNPVFTSWNHPLVNRSISRYTNCQTPVPGKAVSLYRLHECLLTPLRKRRPIIFIIFLTLISTLISTLTLTNPHRNHQTFKGRPCGNKVAVAAHVPTMVNAG